MTTRREFAIYVSSTVEDLEVERKIAAEVIGQIGTFRHSYRASDEGVVATCVSDVRACDLYLGILGLRYGYVPDGEDDLVAKSITELEYDACENPGDGRQRIPRLIFIKPLDHNPGIAQKYVDQFSRLKTADRMKRFLDRVNGLTEVPFFFRTPEQLRAELFMRIKEKAADYHSGGANSRGILGGARHWRTRLAAIAIAGTPGSDDALLQALRAHGGDRLTAFELSPESKSYVADADRRVAPSPRELDRGFATAQIGSLIVSPASLPRLKAAEAAVAAMIDVQVTAAGRFVLACAGVPPGDLPAAWQRATPIHIDAAVANGLPQDFVRELDQKVTASAPDLSAGTRLPLPYLILAPTRARVEQMCAADSTAFDAFDEDAREIRLRQFEKIAGKARQLMPDWPVGAYGDQPENWRCFAKPPAAGGGVAGADEQPSADDLVRRAIERINTATVASRERRMLQDARLIARRYRLSDYLDNRFGSRQMIETLRQNGWLIVVDELALLDPAMRAAAEDLLSGNHGAVVSITPFDPAHSTTKALLSDVSYLRVGTLISRFRADHDPRCEVALNSIERVERWLRFTIPELVVANDDQEVQPSLAAQAHLVLPGVKA